MFGLLLAGAAGAALTYFFDREAGERRRNMAQEQLAGVLGRASDQAASVGQRVGIEGFALPQQAADSTGTQTPPLNDATLSQKVESEVFSDAAIPKGKININAEYGVIVLRGEVERADQITSIEAAARRVAGVREVKNLLHLPGSPAPTS